MTYRIRFWSLLALLAALFVSTLWIFLPAEVLAAPPPQREDGYRTMRTVIAEQITGATLAESTDGSTLITDRALQTFGNPTVIVSVDFDAGAATTVVVYCLLYAKDSSGDLEWTRVAQELTATAGTITDAAGDVAAPPLYFDTSGVSHYEIRHALPSSGGVDLVWWSYGAHPDEDPS